MVEPICEDEGLLQEWTPQTQLLQQIPLKIQRGLFFQNLSLTCLDVISEYIALGTNLGFVYWYCRVNGELQKLRFENSYCAVTCIKVLSSVDYMVAAGTNQGTLIVFRIPKIEASLIQEPVKCKQKQIERFTINDLHSAPVSCIEWDQNELKVFSGDRNGIVALTEIDYALHISKSMELLNEQFEVIQLSFSHQILLISTIYRSIICDGSKNWKIHQVGTKERKILGKFGATCCNFQHELVLYASRPGCRLWLSDKNGIVQQTLIFKSAMHSNCQKIQLINPVDKKKPYDASFGKVLQFGDNKLVTYNSEILYVLHPGAVSVVSVLDSARKILDLAINENEIFILEGDRSLLRISPIPDKYSDTINQTLPRKTSFNLDNFAAKIKYTAVESLKKITKDLIITPEQTSPNSPPALADEALELPPIVNLPAKILPTIYAGGDIEIHSSFDNNLVISDCSTNFHGSPTSGLNSPFSQDFQEEIITRPLRKRRQNKSKISSQSQDSKMDSVSVSSEDRLVWGIANELSFSDESSLSQPQSSFSVLSDISSLLNQPKIGLNEIEETGKIMKSSDSKSQTSLDTCESVSERLMLTSEMFREEQEKTFARLANRSFLGNLNSEKTDNMSVSLNTTISSSISSKISEYLHSPSFNSENSNLASKAKSNESQSPDNFQNEQEFSSGDFSVSNNLIQDNSSRETKITDSTDSSLSSRNSQRERLYPRWSNTKASGVSEMPENLSGHDFKDEIPENVTKEPKEKDLHEVELPSTSDFQILDSGDRHKPFFTTDSSQHSNKISEFDEAQKINKETENDFTEETSAPVEPLNYGPPSGSSMTSSQPSSNSFSIPTTSKILESSIENSFDVWPSYNTPGKIISFDASNDYVVCIDINLKVYFSNLSGLSLSWTGLNFKASLIKVSNDGSIVWMLTKSKTLLALVNPSAKSPSSNQTQKIAGNVKTFAIDSSNNNGWIVSLNGGLTHFSKNFKEEIQCHCKLIDVACGNGRVLGLTTENVIICKFSKEGEFKIIKTLKLQTNCLTFGPKDILWVVHDSKKLYFSIDSNCNPQWWQIEIGEYIYQNTDQFGISKSGKKTPKLKGLNFPHHDTNVLVAANDHSVWIFNKFDSSVWVNKIGFTGYIWTKVSCIKLLPSIQWYIICAEGISNGNDMIWLLSLDGNIFCLKLSSNYFQSVPIPCEEKVLCMTWSSDAFWILSETGSIYSRQGLTETKISGFSWKEFKSQIDNLRLVWISCGKDVAWACDLHGRAFISIGSQQYTSTSDPNWLEVKGTPKDVKFNKVFVGSQFYMVWAIDDSLNLYVREGICPHYQIGTSWVFVCGIKAVHISLSGTSVWAVSPKGEIYRRCGILESNYIGDYWKMIPGNIKMISSSFDEDVWALNQENEIIRLNYFFKELNETKINEKEEIRSSKEDISWEIVK